MQFFNRNRLVVVVAALVVSFSPDGSAPEAQRSRDVTAAMVDQWMMDLSNWGRWGNDDEMGTLNLITADKRRSALALATAGVSVSLSHNYLTERAVDATSPTSTRSVSSLPTPKRPSDRPTWSA